MKAHVNRIQIFLHVPWVGGVTEFHFNSIQIYEEKGIRDKGQGIIHKGQGIIHKM